MKKTLLTAGLAVALSAPASAITFDFIDYADNPLNPNYAGELGGDPLSFTENGLTVSAYGTSTTDFLAFGQLDLANYSEYAYLDKKGAGMGVCTVIDANKQCDPSSDDNILTGEVLTLAFSESVSITELFFTGRGGTHSISDPRPFNGTEGQDFALFIDGVFVGNETLDSYASWSLSGTVFSFAADDYSNGQFSNDGDQFYIGGVTVPEPGSLALLGLGLVGLGLSRRSAKA